MGFFFQKEMKTINMSNNIDENYWQEKNGVVLMQSFFTILLVMTKGFKL